MRRRVKHVWIDYSTLAAYADCARKVAFGSIEGLVPKEEVDPSLTAAYKGTIIHLALDALARGEPIEPIFKSIKGGILNIESHLSGSVTHLREIVSQYMTKYLTEGQDRDWNVLRTESPFEMSVNERVTYRGKVDKVVLKNNRVVIVDHKTSISLSTYVEPDVAISDQYTGYIALAKANGVETNEIIVDGISTAQKALNSGDGLFVRYESGRTDEQVEEYKERLDFLSNRMISEIEAGTFVPVQRKSVCLAFGSKCPFLEVCSATGSTRESLLRSNFIKNPSPWEGFHIEWEA